MALLGRILQGHPHPHPWPERTACLPQAGPVRPRPAMPSGQGLAGGGHRVSGRCPSVGVSSVWAVVLNKWEGFEGLLPLLALSWQGSGHETAALATSSAHLPQEPSHQPTVGGGWLWGRRGTKAQITASELFAPNVPSSCSTNQLLPGVRLGPCLLAGSLAARVTILELLGGPCLWGSDTCLETAQGESVT